MSSDYLNAMRVRYKLAAIILHDMPETTVALTIHLPPLTSNCSHLLHQFITFFMTFSSYMVIEIANYYVFVKTKNTIENIFCQTFVVC